MCCLPAAAVKNTAELRAGESVAVLGTGGVGANCIQVARAFGADKVGNVTLMLVRDQDIC